MQLAADILSGEPVPANQEVPSEYVAPEDIGAWVEPERPDDWWASDLPEEWKPNP